VTRASAAPVRLRYKSDYRGGYKNYRMLSHCLARPEIGLSHSGRGSFRVLTATFVAVCLPHVATAAGEFRVLHHQAVQIQSRADTGAHEHVTFDAYGRRFELSLVPNERIRRALSGKTQTMPLQGTVDGIQSSWVRLTRGAGGWRGMIFDGHSLYAIEPASDIAGTTVEPLAATGSAPVVYRLDDALLPVEQMSCEIVEAPKAASTAAEAFSHLSHELQAQAATGELAAMKQVRVGIVGDFEFANLFATGTTTAEEAVTARMNIVDGIFTSQLGVKLSLAPLTIFTNPNDPFTSQTVAGNLLNELRAFRSGSAAQLALGLTHLMTGRDLDGDTVGIAYIGAVCDGANAASLSEGRRPTTLSALIAAHEIGHNFGAPHDGETGACMSTPQTFLMAPRLNGSDQFSACSITQIQPYLNNSRCLTAYNPPDAALEIDKPAVPAQTGTAFGASFVVRAVGDDASNAVTVTATLPTTVTITSVTANGGSCTTGAGTATCTLGTLPSGDTRQIDMNLTATESGSLSINLLVDSSNDGNASNDGGTITVSASGNPVVNPPATGGTTATGGGGGGGGRIDFALLALLLSATLLKIRGARLVCRAAR
jgi:hypothetical protein